MNIKRSNNLLVKIYLFLFLLLPMSSQAQVVTSCVASNIYDITISSTNRNALPEPNASLEVLTECVAQSLDAGVNPCGCSIDACSPVASFPTGSALSSLLNTLMKRLAKDATTPNAACK